MSTFRRSMRTGDPSEFWSPWSTEPMLSTHLDPSWPILTAWVLRNVADPVETCDVHWISLNYIDVQDVRVTYRSDMNHVWHRSRLQRELGKIFQVWIDWIDWIDWPWIFTDPVVEVGCLIPLIPLFPIISCRPTATARIQTSVLPRKRRFCPFCLSKICSNARTGAEPCRACRAVDRSISDCWDRCGLIVCWSAGPFE